MNTDTFTSTHHKDTIRYKNTTYYYTDPYKHLLPSVDASFIALSMERKTKNIQKIVQRPHSPGLSPFLN